MTDLLDDFTLLAALGEVLAPEPATPGVAAMDALHLALEQRAVGAVVSATGTSGPSTRDGELAPVVALASVTRFGHRGGALHRLRHPVAAAVAVAVLATSGVAAAAVATDHLPGPTRAVAFDLGLPVTSPAIAGVRGTLTELQEALAAGDPSRVRTAADLLRAEMAGLSPSDRAPVQAAVDFSLARADAFLAASPSGPSATGAGAAPTGDSGQSAPSGTSPVAGAGSSSDGQSVSGSRSHPAGSGTITTEPESTGPTAAVPGSAGGSSEDGAPAGGTDDGSGSTTTSTPPGSTTSTTRPRNSGDDGSDDGSSDDRSGATDNIVAPTPTTTATH